MLALGPGRVGVTKQGGQGELAGDAIEALQGGRSDFRQVCNVGGEGELQVDLWAAFSRGFAPHRFARAPSKREPRSLSVSPPQLGLALPTASSS